MCKIFHPFVITVITVIVMRINYRKLAKPLLLSEVVILIISNAHYDK